MDRNTSRGINASGIPQELQALEQWVLWRSVRKGDKPSKIPYQSNGEPAKTTDPTHWTTFEKAVQALGGPVKFDGVGFVFTQSDHFWGIDFDNCLADDGSLLEWAKGGVEILREAGAYIEISPSGKGLKAFFRCTLPPVKGRKGEVENEPGSRVEVYSHGRYFTVTGRVFGTKPGALRDATESYAKFADWMDTIKAPKGRETPKAIQQSSRSDGPDAREHAEVLQGGEASSTNWTTTGRPEPAERARLYAKSFPPAISGQNGHGATFRLACVLVRGFGLGIDGARPILEEWNQQCQPPWSPRELEHKLSQAEKSDSPSEWMLQDDRPDAHGVDLSALIGKAQATSTLRDESKQPSNWDEIEGIDQSLRKQLESRVRSFADMVVGLKIAKEQLKNQTRSTLKPVELPEPPEGFLRDFTNWQLATATRPQKAFAIFGSITLVSTLIGRKVKLGDGRETRPVVYGLMLGGTSRGKDHALERINSFMDATGITEDILVGAATSDASLYNAHKDATCARLWLADEFGQYFQSNRNDKAMHSSNVIRTLLELYSARSKPQHRGKAYADRKNNFVLRYPHQNLYAVSTPGVILENLRPSDVESGLVGRLLIVGGDDKPKIQKPQNIAPPDDLLGIAKNWFAYQPGTGNLSGFSGGGEKVIPITAEAEFLADLFAKDCDERLELDANTGALWGRAAEKASQLALISACARITNPTDGTQVTETDYRWAMDTVTRVTEWTIGLIDDNISENRQEAMVKAIRKIIRDAGSKGITRSEILRTNRGIKQPERDPILRDLRDSNEIIEMTVQGEKGAKATRYFDARIVS